MQFCVSPTLLNPSNLGLSRSWYTGIPDFVLPNRSIYGIPVDSRYFGIAILGGRNWIAALAEQKIRIPSSAMKGLAEI